MGDVKFDPHGPTTLALRPRRAAELLVDELRRVIVHGAAGDTLPPERVILERFDVSRATLREALLILESEGLIEVRRGVKGGAVILEPSAENLARSFAVHLQRQRTTIGDLLIARETLEVAAVRLAAARGPARTAVLRAALDAEADAIRQETDERRLAAVLIDFHDLIFELSGSTTLQSLGGMLRSAVTRYTGSGLEMFAPDTRRAGLAVLHKAHSRIAQAIENGDQDEAARLCRQHLRAGHTSPDTELLDVYAHSLPGHRR